MTEVRTRFAPSPTGYLHIGSARTALYAYLYAKHCRGKFILRIEDTDTERSTQESVEAILESMEWLGLGYDEGPFYQTKRFDRYREVIQQLVSQQKAYKCYCTKERLEQLREEQSKNKQKPKYDHFCRERKDHPENVPYVIRFANPLDGEVIFDDAVHGKTVFKNTELDDLIILRSDNTPTYNFCVVIDDWDMNITHVIRGDDHLNNTPRQINILQALGANIPEYAHIPMILGNDGKRLSKRHGAVSVMQFREEGILPHALLNSLVRLGWSHGDQEIFSASEMIELFDINKVNKSAAAFNPQKLLWLNQHYLKSDSPAETQKELHWHLQQQKITTQSDPDLLEVIKLQASRVKTLKEMAERSRFFYEEILPSEELLNKSVKPQQTVLKKLYEELEKCENSYWTDEQLHTIISTIAEQNQIKLGDLAQAVRVVLTGTTVSPPLNSTMRLLGREKVLRRLAKYC
jgi:glutamyl-tRNA synthetase